MNPCCTHAVVSACSTDAQELADLRAKVAELEVNPPETETPTGAMFELLLDTIEKLLAMHKGNEFKWPKEQAAVRAARAVLVECGR
jgi:hypothetical protein